MLTKHRGEFYLVMGALVFSFNGVISTLVLEHISPFRLAQVRSSGAFLILLMITLFIDRHSLRTPKKEIPMLVAYGIIGFAAVQAGYFLGGSVHDVAQALGSGYAYSPAAGETATIVKLARVALLAPVLAVIALIFPSQLEISGGKRAAPAVPWFVVGFFVVAGVNSTGVIPLPVSQFAAEVAAVMLAVSVAATAIRSPLAEIMKTGPKPLIVIAAATLASFALALLYAWLRIA